MTKILKDSVIPYYYQLSDILKKEISDECYNEDNLLPSERILCEKFKVSRATVRQAMQILKEEGLIEKVRGIGTKVKIPEKIEQDLLGYHNFDLQMSEQGFNASVKILEFEQVNGPGRIHSLLEINATDPVLKVIRLRYVGNDPLFIEKIYLPRSQFLKISKKDFETTNILLKVLEKDYQIKLGDTMVYIEPVILNESECRLLEVKVTPAPGLIFERISYTETGKPVSVTKRVFRGDRCRHILNIEHK